MHEIEIISLKLVLAVILGGLIGLERDIRGRTAGLRTHILVCLGSTLFMLSSTYIFNVYHSFNADSVLRIDPARIAAQVITGIGFIGAGTILRSGASIRGLTTAGSIWVSSGIGISIGLGYFIPAFMATAITLIALLILNKLELVYLKDSYFNVKLVMENREGVIKRFFSFIEKENITVKDFELKNLLKDGIIEIAFTIVMKRKGIKRHYFSKSTYSRFLKEFEDVLLEIVWQRS